MKKVLIVLILIIVGFISFGYIQKHNGLNGDKWIGIGILLVTFCGLKMWRKCNTKPSQI